MRPFNHCWVLALIDLKVASRISGHPSDLGSPLVGDPPLVGGPRTAGLMLTHQIVRSKGSFYETSPLARGLHIYSDSMFASNRLSPFNLIRPILWNASSLITLSVQNFGESSRSGYMVIFADLRDLSLAARLSDLLDLDNLMIAPVKLWRIPSRSQMPRSSSGDTLSLRAPEPSELV